MKRTVSALAAGAVLASGLIVGATAATAATATPSAPSSTSAFPFQTGAAHSFAAGAALQPGTAHAVIPAAEQPSLDDYILSTKGKTSLTAGEFLISTGGAFALYLDPKGPLSLYAAYQTKPLWSVDVVAANPVLTLQTDGNVVLRDGAGRALWATNTTGAHGALAFGFLFDNGEIAALGKAGIVYTTRTAKVGRADAVVADLLSTGGNYALSMQQDGNLVIRHLSGGKAKAIWATGTNVTKVRGPHGVYLTLQSDDNLVIRIGTTVVWATGTHLADPGVPYLQMQDDGNLVLRAVGASGKPKVLWASGTAGKV